MFLSGLGSLCGEVCAGNRRGFRCGSDHRRECAPTGAQRGPANCREIRSGQRESGFHGEYDLCFRFTGGVSGL